MEGLILFGGAGYIGSNLAVGLQNEYNIVIIDKVPKPDWFDKVMRPESEYFQIDLTVPRPDIKLKHHAKFAIILAALKDVVEGEEKPYNYCRDNINIVINSLEICDLLNINNIISISSCAVYHTATSCAHPKHCFNESDTNNSELPLGIYGYSKRVTEDIVSVLKGNRDDSRVVMLRYANLLGSVSQYPLFPKAGVVAVLAKRPKEFVQRGDGLRDYIDVKDLVEMHRLLLQQWEQKVPIGKPLVFNFGTGKTTKTSEIVEMFKQVIKEEDVDYDMIVTHVPKPTFEALIGCTDMTRFETMFPEWSPKHSIRESIRDYIIRFRL